MTIQSGHHEQTTFDWLIDALGGEVSGEPVAALARPSLENPELLIPTAARAATVSALRRNHDDRSVKAKLRSSLARTAGRVGMLHLAGGETGHFPQTAVCHELQSFFGDPSLHFAMAAGPRRRNRKPVLMAIRPDGEIVGYAKVGWSDFTKGLVQNEYDVLCAVDGKLSKPMVTPQPLELLNVNDRLVAVTTSVHGPEWGRRRVLTPEQIDTIANVGRRRITVSELPWLLSPDFGERHDTSEVSLERAVLSVRESLADHELDVGLWHGDLNPWNLITDHGSVGVIDWEFAGFDRPVGQDRRHLRFESLRRNDSTTPAEAVSTFVTSELAGRSSEPELALYLADVAIRESRLSGQGWSGPMAGFRLPLTLAIERLLS